MIDELDSAPMGAQKRNFPLQENMTNRPTDRPTTDMRGHMGTLHFRA